MAAAEITYRATEYDLVNRTTRQVVLIGEATLTGLGVGGGPVIPPGQPPSDPVHIWGGGNVPMPSPPIANVPGAPGYTPPVSVPPPGSPPVIMPGAHPTHPMVAPAAIIVDYPGIGNVMVPKPLPA